MRRKLEELSELREDRVPPGDADTDGAPGTDEDDWILDAAAREKLRRALLGFDRANILTIHAFCQRILTENAFVQGRLFDEEPTEERDAFHAAFAETLRHDVRPGSAEAALLEVWRRGGNAISWLERTLFDVHTKVACIYPPRAGALRPDTRFDPESLARRGGQLARAAGERRPLERSAQEGRRQRQQRRASSSRACVPWPRRWPKGIAGRSRCWPRWRGSMSASTETRTAKGS